MEFPCPPIVLVPCFKSTLGQCTNGQIKVVNENFSMAQKSVHTLAYRKNIQRWGGKDAKEFLCQSVKHVAAWFCVRIIEHVQQCGKKCHNFWVNFQNFRSQVWVFFEKNTSSITIVGAALPRLNDEEPDAQLSPELGLKKLFHYF
jgi:Asp-tRNA(Asn)/Glu-tRNA(Gln) amidotransferase B subunit